MAIYMAIYISIYILKKEQNVLAFFCKRMKQYTPHLFRERTLLSIPSHNQSVFVYRSQVTVYRYLCTALVYSAVS